MGGVLYNPSDIAWRQFTVSVVSASPTEICKPRNDRVYLRCYCFVPYDTLVGGTPNAIDIAVVDGGSQVSIDGINLWHPTAILDYKDIGNQIFKQIVAQRQTAGAFTLGCIEGVVTERELDESCLIQPSESRLNVLSLPRTA